VILTLASLIGFVAFAVLHNGFYALGELASEIPVVPSVMEFLHAGCFLIAVLVCPALVVVGVVGIVVTRMRNRRSRPLP
jgi:hypothetical protein